MTVATAPMAVAAETDPDADEILRAMSSYLAALDTFSVDAEIDNEIVDLQGQKLLLPASATLLVDRPSRFHVVRTGILADAEFFFDGKQLTLHGRRQNIYAQVPVAGSMDDGIREVEQQLGIDFPGADLLFSDPYATLSSGVTSSRYLGVSRVDGVECHQLAFREDQVDWQLWVQVGEKPLPMRYVITSKWTTGAPQFSLRLSNWNTKPAASAAKFEFKPAAGARKVESIQVDHAGEIVAPAENAQ